MRVWLILSLFVFVFALSLTGCQPAAAPPSPAPPVVEQPAGPDVQQPLREPAAPPSEPSDMTHVPLKLATLPAEERDAGWLSLFDGQTLFGWTAQSKADWRVEDGAIVVSSGEPGLLCTNSVFDDYVLRVEFKSPPGTNSGVFLSTPRKPQDPAVDCYELNIADSDDPFPTGSLVKREQTAESSHSGDWQSYEVTVRQGQVTVVLDGKQVLAYQDPKPLRRGHIGLQLNQGEVAFRNLKIKLLDVPAIFNGKDLTGWKQYPEMDSRFTVTPEGWLNVKNGKGQLETEATYGDFVLQLECITNAPQLNSGIFYRCIPGDVMMGYESQIHNGFKDGDRSRPVDAGTGAIFRRSTARLVAADDQQWFHKTILAHGPHVAVWVNGFQVTDWTDTRAADVNPRKGLRTEAGTLMIQGHDPTTDISFRNLRARELAAAKPSP